MNSTFISLLLVGLCLRAFDCYYFGTNFMVNQNLDEPLPEQNEESLVNTLEPTAYYARNPESARYFRNLVNKFEIVSPFTEHDDGFYQRYYTPEDVQPKEKRFLKSFWEKIKPKKKDKKVEEPAEDDDTNNNDEEFHDASDQFPTPPPRPAPTPENRVEAHVSTSILDDPFYKLKKHCLTSYDELCTSKRKDMLDLVNKCESLQAGNKKVDACSDVLSIYCYVYLTRDLKTCLGKSYDMYIPGSKKYTPAATPPTTTRTTTSTRRGPIEIPVNKPSRPSPPTTTSTTTTTTTTKSTTTAKTSPTPKYPSIKPNVGLVSPFDGPVKSIPNDSEKLKNIGNYCLRTKQRDQNCDKMLGLLKEKFKHCEKMPKSNVECQTFKINFCTAYPGFPCCADALAGRTCSGKQNARRVVEEED